MQIAPESLFTDLYRTPGTGNEAVRNNYSLAVRYDQYGWREGRIGGVLHA